MRQSNTYILVFTAILTLVLGGVLSMTSVTLRPLQIAQEAFDKKKRILGAVLDLSSFKGDKEAIEALYAARIEALVVDAKGMVVTETADGNPLVAERINIQKNHKLKPDTRYYPVFLYRETPESPNVDAYIFPMFGAGLWDWISGYMALGADLNVVRGIVFDHKTETPGLGARIASPEVQARYADKHIFDATGQLVSIRMIKGEKGDPLGPHEVDGMSGATMTGNGVNTMLREYLTYYLPYMEQVRNHSTPSQSSLIPKAIEAQKHIVKQTYRHSTH